MRVLIPGFCNRFFGSESKYVTFWVFRRLPEYLEIKLRHLGLDRISLDGKLPENGKINRHYRWDLGTSQHFKQPPWFRLGWLQFLEVKNHQSLSDVFQVFKSKSSDSLSHSCFEREDHLLLWADFCHDDPSPIHGPSVPSLQLADFSKCSQSHRNGIFTSNCLSGAFFEQKVARGEKVDR